MATPIRNQHACTIVFMHFSNVGAAHTELVWPHTRCFRFSKGLSHGLFPWPFEIKFPRNSLRASMKLPAGQFDFMSLGNNI